MVQIQNWKKGIGSLQQSGVSMVGSPDNNALRGYYVTNKSLKVIMVTYLLGYCFCILLPLEDFVKCKMQEMPKWSKIKSSKKLHSAMLGYGRNTYTCPAYTWKSIYLSIDILWVIGGIHILFSELIMFGTQKQS